jgi:hypothetical protein
MQFDMFAEAEPEVAAPILSVAPLPPTDYQVALDALPEKMRADPVAMHAPKPAAGAQLDEWTRKTQRLYLLWLVGAINRFQYRESCIANAREILFKLNGLGGTW